MTAETLAAALLLYLGGVVFGALVSLLPDGDDLFGSETWLDTAVTLALWPVLIPVALLTEDDED